jgi:hypothetical protein
LEQVIIGEFSRRDIMEKIMRKILAFSILLCILIFVSSCGSNIVVNDDIIQLKGFSVSADSSAMMTSAKGTAYVRGKDKPKSVQIIASIQIDPNDWGGVSFSFTDGWSIVGITSSYPEKDTQTVPTDYVVMWTTVDSEEEWNKLVEIGRDRSYVPTGGGTGTVVIDLLPDKNTSQNNETFRCLVGVGAHEKNGMKIMNPDYITVELPLTKENEHNQ